MTDGIAMVELLLGLPGMRVLEVAEDDDELVVTVETAAERARCPACGARAQAQDRSTRSVRVLSCFGRPVRLEVRRRRWRCRERACTAKTWTEEVEALDATAVLTRRAGAEACRQVAQSSLPVSRSAARGDRDGFGHPVSRDSVDRLCGRPASTTNGTPPTVATSPKAP